MPQYDIITFDCYGTLIDWEQGMLGAFRAVCADAGEVLAQYARIEPQVEETYRSYREVLTTAAERALEASGCPVPEGGGRFLADSLPDWKPFSDTNAALESLRASGYRLGILSNVDVGLLAATRRHFTVDFDLIVTAEDVRSYKPGHTHFETARRTIGSARWLHAAQSNFHDIVPANALGIPSAWINRKGERALPGGTPSMEFPDLRSFATALASGSSDF